MLVIRPGGAALRPPRLDLRQWLPMIQLVTLASLLLALIPPDMPRPYVEPEAAPALEPHAVTPPAPTYALPPELIGRPEVVELRTSHSATFSMGDGQYAVLQELEPLHYLAEDGSWQPINPAFADVSGGWLNDTNTLQTGLARRSSVAKITADAAGVAWEPQELRVAGADGAYTVAVPLPSRDAAEGVRSPSGERVYYPANWSMAGLQELWAAGYGQSEYSMLLPERPGAGALATPEWLELRTRLSLLPGTSIQVNGQPATLPLETDGAISFVGPEGDPIELEPPYAFERDRPSEGLAGGYALIPSADPNVVELRVRLPYAWFAAAERQYPVVIDPRFIIRSPTAIGNIRSSFSLSSPTPSNPKFIYGSGAQRRIGVWRNDTHIHYDELALMMPMPLLPSGATLTKAHFSAIPSDTNPGGVGSEDTSKGSFHMAQVELYAIKTDKWFLDFTMPETDGPPLSTLSGQAIMRYNRNDSLQSPVTWDVTERAKFWVPSSGSDGPKFNSGLLMKMKILPGTCNAVLPCRAFYFSGTSIGDAWSQEELAHTYSNATPELSAVRGSRGGGLRMTVFYNTPTLTPGSIRTVQPLGNPTSANNNLPRGNQNPYYEAYHTYRVDGMNDPKWYAMVARGFGPQKIVDNSDNTRRVTTPTAGNIEMRLSGPGVSESAYRPFVTRPGRDQVSYMLLNGRSLSPQMRQPRWLDLAKGEADGNTNDGRANGYDVRIITELDSISTQGGSGNRFRQRNLDFPTSIPMALYNLDLAANTNSMVTVRVNGSNLGINLSDFYSHLKFEVVAPYQISVSGVETGMPNSGGSTNMVLQGTPSNRSTPPFQAGLGPLALAITYNGPNTYTNEKPPVPHIVSPGDQPTDNAAAAFGADLPTDNAALAGEPGLDAAPPNLAQLVLKLQIEVISCPSGTFPAGGNTCQSVQCPTKVASPPSPRSVASTWLWSGAGWVQNGNTWRSNITDPENQPAPMIGKPNSQYPSVAVIGGVIQYPASGNQSAITLEPINGLLGSVYLIDCRGLTLDYFPVYRGGMQYAIRAGNPAFEPSGYGVREADPWRTEDVVDLSQIDFTVRPYTQSSDVGAAVGRATLQRLIHPDTGGSPITFRFAPEWTFDVKGWLNIGHKVNRAVSNPATYPIASMTLAPGLSYSLDVPPLPPGAGVTHKSIARQFQSVRATAATITQPEGLGGASKPIQVLFMPRGMNPDSSLPVCTASCLDLRATNDTYTSPNRVWEMPDVRTTGQAGLMQFSREGEVMVFSADHPNARLQDFEQDFSFEAHKASVKVARERCVDDPKSPGYTPNAPLVTVIRGEARIAVPNIGSSGDPGGLIAASFKLCSSTLRSVRMEFSSPIGLPIGSTGMFLTGLRGGVDIFPDYTQIQVGVTFQAAQGGDGGLFTAQGDVLIDTRGLFEFQGKAKILGTVNADGAIWVAWSPLDVGFDVKVSVGNWLEGRAYAHMWRGRGWGNKYPWLPNDNALHFTGMISAKLYIPAGAIIDVWELKLPPSRVTLAGIELAFGEFCTNSGCTESCTNSGCSQYEWGIKGKFTILDFDVGLYYGFEEGLDFILGNDDHILIDQYGGSSLLAEQLAGLSDEGVNLLAAPAASNGVATQAITIRPEVEQILVGLTWLSGNLQLSMIRPDGVEITTKNAAQHGAKFDIQNGAVVMTVQDPQPGTWQAKFSGLGEAGDEHYTFVYFANRGAPGEDAGLQAAGDRLSVKSAPGGRYEITWPVPADAKANHTIGLYYHRTQEISGTLHQGVPIVKNLPYRDGRYLWDPTGVLDGEYQIYAVVDDGYNALPESQISIPNDTCIPLHGPFPRARAFDATRFPGTDIFTATTTVQLTDTIAPPTPQGLTLLPDGGGILARWNPASDRDTAGYVLRWGPKNGNSFNELHQQEVAGSDKPSLRIGGLATNTTYGVTIQAIDANGNLSPASPVLFSSAGDAAAPIPLAPTDLARTSGGSDSVNLSWKAAEGPVPAGYTLSYTRLDVRPEVVSEQSVNGTTATISGLATGGTYDIVVRARNADGWESAASERLRVVISSGADNNSDGLPDDWADVYKVSGANNDPDGDGLTNAEERAAGTNPASFDSDEDGNNDKEEVTAGTDPLRNENPDALFVYPRLAIEEEVLTFRVRPTTSVAGTAALSLPPAQTVAYHNTGGGTLKIKAVPEAPWLSARVVGDQIEVSLKQNGLTPGFHSGVVRLASDGGDPLGSAPQCVRVKAWVYPDGTSPAPAAQLFLPSLQR